MGKAVEIWLVGLATFWVGQVVVSWYKCKVAQKRLRSHMAWLEERKTADRPESQIALIIPVKGKHPNFTEFLNFILSQKHVHYRVIFVTESERDPAYVAIQARLDEGPPPVEVVLLSAGLSETEGQKVHNQRFALKQLNSADQIIAFADADIEGPEDWLFSLTEPLHTDTADFTTGSRWFIPARRSWNGHILARVAVAAEPLIGPHWRMCLWGGSMAMTRQVFDELDILSGMAGSLSDDGQINHIAIRAGKRIRYARAVAVPSPVDHSWDSFWEFAERQYRIMRLYVPRLWWLSGITLITHWLSLLAMVLLVLIGKHWILLLIPTGVIWVVLRNRQQHSYLSERFPPSIGDTLKTSLAGNLWSDELVNGVHLLIWLRSAFSNCVTWAGIRYRVNGRQAIDILERA